MPIINGKRRYVPEARADESAAASAKRYQPPASESVAAPIKRYQPPASESAAVPAKRYQPPASKNAVAPAKRYVRAQGSMVRAISGQEAVREFIGSYEFEVRFNLIVVSFSKISNIGNEIETEVFVEGGNNDHPIVRQKARQKPDTIVFEKGMADTLGGDVFGLLRQGMKLTNILISVNKGGRIARLFCIDEGLIISKKFTDLDANSNSIFIEKLELAHTGISEIVIPF